MHVPVPLRIWMAAAVFTAPILASPSQSQSQSRNPKTSTADVVNAAMGYVAKYEQQLTSILATEETSQLVLRRIPGDPAAPRSRALKSEMYFIFSPAEHEWMAVRDVNAVDGHPVTNPPDLTKAMTRLPVLQVARALKSYSSRYNIGSILRNFGEPTLSLLVLDANHRGNFGFAATRTDRKPGEVLVTLYFREHGPDTLLHDLNGVPVVSEGELVIEAGTGRIRRATLKARLGSVQAQLTTTYREESKLGLWVPDTFSEEYEDGSPPASGTTTNWHYESIRCDAKYSDFRRFESFGRIK